MTSNSNNDETKTAICIRDMAALVGLSRQRFMQLVKAGVFPQPLYDVATKRPFFSADMQQVCLEVRRRNCGINGRVVMFYARRSITPSSKAKPTKPRSKPATDRHGKILDGLKALGLVTVTAAQVAEAVKQRFPKGTAGVDAAEMIRAIFLHLRGKNSGEKVG